MKFLGFLLLIIVTCTITFLMVGILDNLPDDTSIKSFVLGGFFIGLFLAWALFCLAIFASYIGWWSGT